jgi:hypothetical protein
MKKVWRTFVVTFQVSFVLYFLAIVVYEFIKP